MTFKDLAKRISTCYNSLPALIDALRDGFNEVEGGGGGSSDIVYSTTERKIGKWLDDDLYQRTFKLNDLYLKDQNTWYETSISKTANNIKEVKCIVQAISKSGTVWDNLGLATNISDYINLLSCRSSGGINVDYITLQYTKTTA